MSALSIQPIYPIFTDIDGQPLEDGFVWIGQANLDPQVNPVNVFWDAALTIPAGQPIRTLGGYPSNSGTPARLYVNSDYSIRVMNKNGSVVYSAPTATERYSDVVISGVNAEDVVYDPPVTGGVQTNAEAKLAQTVSVKDFGAVGNGVTNDTAALQAAIDYCWDNSITLWIPPGTYITTGLTLTGSSSQQNTILKIRGAGCGNPFAVWSVPSGTVIKSVTDAPVFQIDVPTVTTSAGTLDVEGVVFDGTSTTPVVMLEAFYGIGRFSNCCVFQRGTGNGLQIDWMTTSEISESYFLNKDWNSYTLGASRTGIGIYLSHKYDSGLQTIRKCSSRGFHTAYKIGIGSTTDWTYNASIQDCECSVNYNGIHLTNNARGTWVNNCYLEGGDGGVGIWDQGDYNKVTNCFTFAGYGTHLKSDDFTYGNYYAGNTFSAGTQANQILASITSSGVYGGPGKSFVNNHLSFGGSGGSLAGVIGLQTGGLTPRIDYSGNNFFPRGPWVGGAGTAKTNLAPSPYGFATAFNGDYEFPYISQGAISLGKGYTLSEANVASNILSIAQGSVFDVTAALAVSVNRLSTGGDTGRFIVLKTTNANMTIQDSAYIQTAGGASFAGPGTITFFVERTGGSDYAYEIARTVF